MKTWEIKISCLNCNKDHGIAVTTVDPNEGMNKSICSMSFNIIKNLRFTFDANKRHDGTETYPFIENEWEPEPTKEVE